MKKNKIIIFSLTSFIILGSIVVTSNSIKKDNTKILTPNHEQQKINNIDESNEKQITSAKSSSKNSIEESKNDFNIITIKQNDSEYETKLNTKSSDIDYNKITNIDDYINLSQSDLKNKLGNPLISVINTEEKDNNVWVYKFEESSLNSLLICCFNNEKLTKYEQSTEGLSSDGSLNVDDLSNYIIKTYK